MSASAAASPAHGLRPRVLFVGRTHYALPLPGWLAKKWDALARELDYRVLASAASRRERSEGRFVLVPPARPSFLDGASFYALLPLRVRRELGSFRPQAVVAEDPQTAALVLLGRALSRFRPRVVAEVHGDWRTAARLYGSPLRRPLAPALDRVQAFALRRADAVRGLSPYTARLVEDVRGSPPDALFTTYTDLSVFTSRPVAPLPERPTALFVGVLELYKNVDGLVTAWRSVAPRLPGARLVIVGSGSRHAEVARLRAEFPEHVEHLPRLDPEQVAARLDEATVLLLPSRSEGLPRVALEAFARGRAVIGATTGGTHDLVRDGVEGLLVDPDDVDALADATVRVLSDRALAERFGAAAAARFSEWDSSPEQFARSMRALVEAALGAP